MILFLCYVFPPAAVFFMGRPFSACLNFFLTSCLWVPGVKHALACYADYKVDNVTRKVTGAIHNPAYTRAHTGQSEGRARGKREVEVVVIYDNPHVGKNGTYFRRK